MENVLSVIHNKYSKIKVHVLTVFLCESKWMYFTVTLTQCVGMFIEKITPEPDVLSVNKYCTSGKRDACGSFQISKSLQRLKYVWGLSFIQHVIL